MEQWVCWSVHWPLERSCPSFLSPPPAVWWRFLWLDPSGSFSSDVSHTCSKTFNIIIVVIMNRHFMINQSSDFENRAMEKTIHKNIWKCSRSCLRASGSERKHQSVRHGKSSQFVLPALSMTWLQARHDHFRYRVWREHQGGPTHPAILLRSFLLGMMAISSHTLLLVWKSLPSRV